MSTNPQRSLLPLLFGAASTTLFTTIVWLRRRAALARLHAQLYYGTRAVRLAHVAGHVHDVSQAELRETSDADCGARDIALARIEPLGGLGDEYAHVLVPAIPAFDVQCVRADDVPPLAGHLPLMKHEDGDVQGVQSGIRSALVCNGRGEWMRLKGCGNLYQGFPVEPVDGRPGLVSVRGCTFEHTCLREMLMTEMINSVLEMECFLGANEPVAWYVYNLPDAPLPGIVKTCGVFRTRGNRRLGDHVWVGLERLLPVFLGDGFDAAQVCESFPEERRDPDREGQVTGTPWQVLCGGEFVDLVDFPVLVGDELRKLPDPSSPPKHVPLALHALWERDMRAVCEYLESPAAKSRNVCHNMAYLAWRFGRECGAQLRCLHDADISWGTYVDDLGIHCNAHSNNLVLLPPSLGNTDQFLAPLDFDMAFTRSGFLHSPEQFDEWMVLEQNGMKMALAGDTLISTGVTGSSELPESFEVLQHALRDTLMCAFDAAYASGPDKHPVSPALQPVAHTLCRLALMLTSEDVA